LPGIEGRPDRPRRSLWAGLSSLCDENPAQNLALSLADPASGRRAAKRLL
jgi:hypothetical protein